MRTLLFIISFFTFIDISAKAELASPPPTPSFANDTLFFDLQKAIYSNTGTLYYLDLPIYIRSSNQISSFDFRMKFDQTKLTYISTNKIISQLDPLSYLNPADAFLRNTTSGPSLNYVTPNNTPLLNLRFQLASSCTKVDVSDFNSISSLLNSNTCKNYVTPPLSSSYQASFTSGPVCSLVDVAFTFPSTSFGRTITSYLWNFGNGLTSTLQNAKTQYSQESTYTVSLVAITTEGCKDSISKSIKVNKSPISNFTYVFDKIKDSVYFTNIFPLSDKATLSWEWNFGDTNVSTSQDPVHQYNLGGTYPVSLLTRTNVGCTNTFVSNVVIDKPTANFTSSPNKCKGSAVNFTSVSTFPGGTIDSWAWDFGDNSTSTLQDPTHTYSSAGTFTVKLRVTSNTGAKGTVSKTIVVNNKPIVQFEGDNLSGCSPLNVNFSDLSTTDTGSNYYWDFGDFIISADKSPSHTFLSSRSYTVKEIITAPGGCKDSLIKTSYVTVLNAPVTDFSMSDGCLNTVISFTDQSTIVANNIISWSWNFGDNTTSSIQNPTHIYSTNGNYTVTLTTTSNFGCQSTTTKTLIINPKPIVQFNTPTLSGCTPLNVTFGDLSSTATGSTYNWDFGDNSVSNVKNPIHVYTSNGSFTVKEVVIAPGGCRDSLTKTGYINVLSAISTSFTDTNRCANSTTFFTDKSIISSGTIISWNWDFGNGSSSAIQNPTFVYTSTGKYSVKLIATSNQGCSSSFTKDVIIDQIPVVNFKADVLAGCIPQDVKFTDLSTAPVGSTYEWHFGDGTSGFANDTNHIYTSVDSFTVKYIVISPQGCIDSLVKSKYISLKEAPIADFKIETVSSLLPGRPISFINKSVGAKEYYWNFGDLAFSGIINPSHTYSDSGNYEICLTASSSEFCFSKKCDTITILGSKKLALPTAFSPNGDLKNDLFKLLGGPCKELNFKIFNEWGNLIFESISQEIGWDGTYKGELQPEGSYHYLITGTTVDEKNINLFGIVNLTR